MKAILTVSLILLAAISGLSTGRTTWRQATEKELESLIPARAPVEKERIETEMRTATGVTDGHGKFIAGVQIITAGYAAEGKYSHFFITQVPIKIGETMLKPGDYAFGYKRVDAENLEVRFYEAATGTPVVTVQAKRESKGGSVRSLLITPPDNGNSSIYIGRFAIGYKLAE